MTERDDGKNRDQAGTPRASNGRASGQDGAREPSADSDVLAFFYASAAEALARLHDDQRELAVRAERVARFTSDVGLEASADARREFHRNCDLTEQAGELTYRLIETLRAALA